MFSTISLTAGMETNAVVQTPVRTILMTANGNASFSGSMAATPNPWPDPPIPNPRLTGSSIFKKSKNPRPTVAPKIPVNTTTTQAMEMFPPSSSVITMASPVVILRESNEARTMALDPMLSRRTYHAVPNRPPTLEQSMPAITAGRLSAMIFLRLYMGIPRHAIAGPSRNTSRSPAPAFEGERDPFLYVLRTSSKEFPVTRASSFVNTSVPAVLVISG
mmetsp:Transcript_26563/g.56508  ORF Transcript_26563/g.56508 Transcript_26563/m.56508 type:complete len:218 (-) Transcript_26563:937-1590(-)